MISERLMDPGQFTIRLRDGTPTDVLARLTEFGHVYVMPQQIDPAMFTDATLKAAARWAGVILERHVTNYGGAIHGAGLAWWLGDALGHGDLYTGDGGSGAVNWQTALAGFLPAAITSGTLTDPAGSTDVRWRQVYDKTPAEMNRAVLAQLGLEYRVNPDGTLDAGPPADVFNVDAPAVMVTRFGSGGDPLRFGIRATEIATFRDATRYVKTITAKTDMNNGGYRQAAPLPVSLWPITNPGTYYDVHGNPFVRERVETATYDPAADIGLGSSFQIGPDTSTQWRVTDDVVVLTPYDETLANTLGIGDAFYVYEPPFVTDPGAAVPFRGEWTAPATLRLVAADWPLRNGRGVLHRGTEGEWFNLSPWIAYEQTELARLVCATEIAVPGAPHVTVMTAIEE